MNSPDKKSMIVPQDLFESYNTDQKLDTLFYYVSAIHENSCLQQKECTRRIKNLENRKLVDRGIAAASGGVGGFVAIMLRWISTKFL